MWEQPVVREMSCVFLSSWYLRGRLLEVSLVSQESLPRDEKMGTPRVLRESYLKSGVFKGQQAGTG